MERNSRGDDWLRMVGCVDGLMIDGWFSDVCTVTIGEEWMGSLTDGRLMAGWMDGCFHWLTTQCL